MHSLHVSPPPPGSADLPRAAASMSPPASSGERLTEEERKWRREQEEERKEAGRGGKGQSAYASHKRSFGLDDEPRSKRLVTEGRQPKPFQPDAPPPAARSDVGYPARSTFNPYAPDGSLSPPRPAPSLPGVPVPDLTSTWKQVHEHHQQQDSNSPANESRSLGGGGFRRSSLGGPRTRSGKGVHAHDSRKQDGYDSDGVDVKSKVSTKKYTLMQRIRLLPVRQGWCRLLIYALLIGGFVFLLAHYALINMGKYEETRSKVAEWAATARNTISSATSGTPTTTPATSTVDLDAAALMSDIPDAIPPPSLPANDVPVHTEAELHIEAADAVTPPSVDHAAIAAAEKDAEAHAARVALEEQERKEAQAAKEAATTPLPQATIPTPDSVAEVAPVPPAAAVPEPTPATELSPAAAAATVADSVPTPAAPQDVAAPNPSPAAVQAEAQPLSTPPEKPMAEEPKSSQSSEVQPAAPERAAPTETPVAVAPEPVVPATEAAAAAQFSQTEVPVEAAPVGSEKAAAPADAVSAVATDTPQAAQSTEGEAGTKPAEGEPNSNPDAPTDASNPEVPRGRPSPPKDKEKKVEKPAAKAPALSPEELTSLRAAAAAAIAPVVVDPSAAPWVPPTVTAPYLLPSDVVVVLVTKSNRHELLARTVTTWGALVPNLLIFSDRPDYEFNLPNLTVLQSTHPDWKPIDNKYHSWRIGPLLRALKVDAQSQPQGGERFYLVLDDVTFPLLDQIASKLQTYRQAHQGAYPLWASGPPTLVNFYKSYWGEQQSKAYNLFKKEKLQSSPAWMTGFSTRYLEYLGEFLADPEACPTLFGDDLALAALTQCAGGIPVTQGVDGSMQPDERFAFGFFNLDKSAPTQPLDPDEMRRKADAFHGVNSGDMVREAYEGYYEKAGLVVNTRTE